MKKLIILVFLLVSFNLVQSQKIAGDWYGSLEVRGTELPLVFHFKNNDTAYSSSMDSPKQGAFDVKMDHTTYKELTLELSLAMAGVRYVGKYDQENDLIKGTFEQNGMSLPLNLSREKPAEKEKPGRPQEPKAPFPYYSENVSFFNLKDSIKLSGTLTLPEKEQNFPAVILISGSGPQDRNEEILGHKPFLVLSDYLTRQGIAVSTL